MIYTQWRRSSSAPIHVISYSLLWSVICTVLIKSPEILSSCCLTHPLLPSNGFPLVEPIMVPLTIITDLPFSSIWWLCSCWSLGNGPSRRSWKELLWRKSMHLWSVIITRGVDGQVVVMMVGLLGCVFHFTVRKFTVCKLLFVHWFIHASMKYIMNAKDIHSILPWFNLVDAYCRFVKWVNEWVNKYEDKWDLVSPWGGKISV